MPAATLRIIPARVISLWLTISVSEGASFRVGRNILENRISVTSYQLPVISCQLSVMFFTDYCSLFTDTYIASLFISIFAFERSSFNHLSKASCCFSRSKRFFMSAFLASKAALSASLLSFSLKIKTLSLRGNI